MAKKDADISRVCEYCRFASAIAVTEEMLCEVRGVVAKGHSCRKFIYDPLKRVPPRPVALNTEKLKKEDFSL